jgi:hypothetical protein
MSAAKVDQMPPVSRVCSGPGSACRRANGVRPTATDRTKRGDAQDSHQRVSPGQLARSPRCGQQQSPGC